MKGPAKPVSRREVDARAAAKRDEMFARICGEDGMTPHQLSRLPRVELVGRVRRFCGGKPIDENLVPLWAADYARRSESTPCP